MNSIGSVPDDYLCPITLVPDYSADYSWNTTILPAGSPGREWEFMLTPHRYDILVPSRY